MRNILIILACIYQSLAAYSQDKIENVNEYIYNQVYKNIAAFNIYYASKSFNGIYYINKFKSNADFFYHWFIADYGYKLYMKINQMDSLYPNPKFHLYKIHINGFDYVHENDSIPEIGSLGPTTTLDFLIALNENNGDIKFISGQFFSSYISGDFKIDKNDPTSLISYLGFRTFDVGGVNIKFKKKRHRKWIFEGYSEIYKGPMVITVNRKDMDQVQTSVKSSL